MSHTGKTPYLEQNFLHANRKGLEGNYYWLSFCNWPGARTIFHTGSNQQTFKNSLQFNQREKIKKKVTAVFLCEHSFYFYFYTAITKPKYTGVLPGTKRYQVKSQFFVFCFFNFSFYTSSLLHKSIPLVLSFPWRQEVFYSASNSAGILLFFKCLGKGNRIFADERKDNKDLKLDVPLLKSSCIGQM